MERFLNWLDRRLGRRIPSGMAVYLVGAWAFAYAVLFFKPELGWAFTLDRSALLRGEVWRALTFLLVPPSLGGGILGPIIAIFVLMFFYTVVTSLESEWGPVRFWFYYLLGALGTIAGAFITGSATNAWLNLSLLIAFGTVFPDYEILLFFVLPVKMKWLALIDGAFLAWQFVAGGPAVRAAIIMAVLNYLLFFAAHLVEVVRGKARVAGRRSQMDRFRAMSAPARKPRICARCGKSEADDPRLEFRVCDCEKCGGKATDYCLEHARAH